MKVGCSHNPVSRIATLQKYHRGKISLVCCVRGSFDAEHNFHTQFSKQFKRKEGDQEWFMVGRAFDVKKFLGNVEYVPVNGFEYAHPFTTKLPRSLCCRLKKAAKESGLKMSAVVKQAAELWLKENNA